MPRHTYLIDGHAPKEGEVFRNPDLAHTLETIAKGGRDAFYKGIIATQLTPISGASAAICATTILPTHHGEWVEPVSVNYRGYDVYELPPNGQGVATLRNAANP